jgi:uncharacterized membrane protein YdbT with pleckstrin-like domain
MSYIQESLSKNEEIKKLFKIHWVDIFSKMFLPIILSIPTFGVSLLFVMYLYFYFKKLEQGVTNKRIILKKGIIARNTKEMKLDAVETVEIKQSVIGRLFGFGTVKITGRGLSDLIFNNIDNPIEVKKDIESLLL